MIKTLCIIVKVPSGEELTNGTSTVYSKLSTAPLATLFGATTYELDRVQRLQNSAARLICSTPLREHITLIT